MGFNLIFLHRSNSQKPFLHHLNTENILQDLEFNDENSVSASACFKNKTISSFYENIYKEYHESKDKLLLIEYFSVTEYLNLLIDICKLLNPFKTNAILLLAAAVSDFYLPTDLMAEHKIQSGNGNLELCLKPVPKLIKFIKKSICPDAFLVSFKLETDESLIIKKAKESLQKYKHDLVISNCLATRKSKLILLDNKGEEVIEKQNESLIEGELISKVIQKYNEYKNNK